MICVSCSQCKTNQKFNKHSVNHPLCRIFLPLIHYHAMPCVFVRLLWLAELIAKLKLAINSIVFNIVCVPKIVYWLICNYWLTRVQAHEKFHDAEKKKTQKTWENPFNIMLYVYMFVFIEWDRESLDPFKYYMCILPSSEINSYKAPINPVEMVFVLDKISVISIPTLILHSIGSSLYL